MRAVLKLRIVLVTLPHHEAAPSAAALGSREASVSFGEPGGMGADAALGEEMIAAVVCAVIRMPPKKPRTAADIMPELDRPLRIYRQSPHHDIARNDSSHALIHFWGYSAGISLHASTAAHRKKLATKDAKNTKMEFEIKSIRVFCVFGGHLRRIRLP